MPSPISEEPPASGPAGETSPRKPGGSLASVMVVSTFRGLAALLAIVLGVFSARYFGTSLEKDCYVIAQTGPNLLSTILLGGIYSMLMVSLAEAGRTQGAAGQMALVRATLRRLGLALAPVVGVALLFPRLFIRVVAPGFGPSQVELAGKLLILAAMAMVASVVFAVLRSLFHSRMSFSAPGLANLVTSVATLAVLVLLVDRLGIFALALGALAGSALSVLALLLIMGRGIKDPPGFEPPPPGEAARGAPATWRWSDFLWMSLGSNFGQVNLLVDNAFGSFLPVGSIALMGFAFVIMSGAESLTTYSLAEVALPVFTMAVGRGTSDLGRLLRVNLRHMLLLTAPLSAGCLVFGAPVARLLFERGEFDSAATASVGVILACFAPQVLFAGYLALYWRVLVARRRLRAIGWAAAAAIILNAALDYVLMGPFGISGIALSTSLVTLALAILLGYLVRREGIEVHVQGDTSFTAKVLFCAALMGAMLFFGSAAFERFQDISRESIRLAEVVSGLAIAAAAYFGSLRLLRVEEVRVIGRMAGLALPWMKR